MPMSGSRKRALDRPESSADASEQEPPDRLSFFQTRLATGDYDALFGEGLRRTLQRAAADATLEAEIGALRVALAKLLHEEDDPSRLAAGISRVAGVAVQAARLRNSGGADAEEFRSAMLRGLEAFEKEHALPGVQGQDQNQTTNVERQRDDAER